MANNTSGLHGEFEKEEVTLWSGNCAYGSTIEVPNLDKYKRIVIHVQEAGKVICEKNGTEYCGIIFFNSRGNPYISCAEIKVSGNTVTNNGCGFVTFSQLPNSSNSFRQNILAINGLPY